jgi:hypothetical protein
VAEIHRRIGISTFRESGFSRSRETGHQKSRNPDRSGSSIGGRVATISAQGKSRDGSQREGQVSVTWEESGIGISEIPGT